MALDTSKLGLPVEIGQIGKELKKLWDSDGGTMTRASLINFAVYCEGAEAGSRNTDFIDEFTRDHACRALLIIAEPEAPEPRTQAWINAHCHLSRAGAKQVCCEQITFLLEGAAGRLIPNIVFSNLDTDLPLVLWWQEDLPEPIDAQLWAWVDRLVFDSQRWNDPARQFTRLLASLEEAQGRLALCDLNWTRSLHLRQAFAQMFDHVENRQVLAGLQKIAICHAPEFRCTALLVAGWFAAQLKLELRSHGKNEAVFASADGAEVRLELKAAAGRSIGCCTLTAADGGIEILRDVNANFFRVEVRLSGGRQYQHLLPAGDNLSTTLVAEELALGGRHRVYLRALAVAQQLMAPA